MDRANAVSEIAGLIEEAKQKMRAAKELADIHDVYFSIDDFSAELYDEWYSSDDWNSSNC